MAGLSLWCLLFWTFLYFSHDSSHLQNAPLTLSEDSAKSMVVTDISFPPSHTQDLSVAKLILENNSPDLIASGFAIQDHQDLNVNHQAIPTLNHSKPFLNQGRKSSKHDLTRRADPAHDSNSDDSNNDEDDNDTSTNDGNSDPNPFRMAFVSDTFQFADFPPNQDLRNCAAMAVLSALRLIDAAVRALNSDPLSNSFRRYFQPDQLCLVRAMFQAFLELSGTIPKTLAATTRVYTIYNGEDFLEDKWCSSTDAFAYHMPPSDDFDDPAIVICQRTWLERARTLEDVNCDQLRADRYVTSRGVPIGFILMHEIFHDFALSEEVASIRIVDIDYNLPPFVYQEKDYRDPFTAYGPFWSQYANEIHHDGIYNADNYGYFAYEVFLAEICGLGFNGFGDPPFDAGIVS